MGTDLDPGREKGFGEPMGTDLDPGREKGFGEGAVTVPGLEAKTQTRPR
jgi:hypothetical protein